MFKTLRLFTAFCALFTFSQLMAAPKVKQVDNQNDMIAVDVSGESIDAGDKLIITSDDGRQCPLTVKRVKGNIATLDTSFCMFKRSIKVGQTLEKSFIEADKQQVESGAKPGSLYSSGLPSDNESWYTLWGIGGARITYGDSAIQDVAKNSSSGSERTQIAMDLLGFYFPFNGHRTMGGFIINTVGDVFTDKNNTNDTMTIMNFLYAGSVHHFFGPNIGSGPFLRADLGFSRSAVTIKSGGFEGSNSGKGGLGYLVGGGYAFPVWQGTRILANLNYSHRSAKVDNIYVNSVKRDDFSASMWQLTVGFLF